MHIVALLLTILGLGAFWIFVIPSLQSRLPASFTSNTWFNLATVGALLLITVFVVGFVFRMLRLPEVARA